MKPSIKRNVRLFLNRILFTFPIKIINGKVKINIHEKYRKTVKYLKYFLMFIGLITSLIVFKSIIVSFMFSLILLSIGLILEGIGFNFYTMYVTPLSDKELTLDKWIGVGFGYLQADSHQIPLISWIFSDIQSAQAIYDLLLNWNYGNIRDEEGNINISVITNKKEKSYYFILTPSLKRRGIVEMVNAVQKEIKSKKETFDDQHQQLITFQYVRKVFDYSENSYQKTFQQRYSNGVQYFLQFCLSSSIDIESKPIDALSPLSLFSINFKEENSLTRKDIEYDLVRL